MKKYIKNYFLLTQKKIVNKYYFNILQKYLNVANYLKIF